MCSPAWSVRGLIFVRIGSNLKVPYFLRLVFMELQTDLVQSCFNFTLLDHLNSFQDEEEVLASSDHVDCVETKHCDLFASCWEDWEKLLHLICFAFHPNPPTQLNLLVGSCPFWRHV